MAHQFCTFHVGDLFLGIEVERVQEVIRDSDITPVPTAPPSVRGLINLRGQIVTAIDLGTLFGIADREGESSTVLVLDAGSALLSFVVDRAGDVVEVNDESFEKPPDTLKGAARRLIRGTYKLQKKLLLVLNVEHALELDADTGGDKAS
jgi:purine-binding chemotaxis protein CheW